MRILLAQNSLYFPSHGGGDKSNRLLMEALAAQGHDCRVVARISNLGAPEHERYLGQLARRSVDGISTGGGVVHFRHNGVAVHVVTNTNLRAYFASHVESDEPDVILCSTDDPAQILLGAALEAAHARVFYLARATLALPFGPDCAFPSPSKTKMIRQAELVVGVSQYVADYVRKWSGIDAVHVPISLMEPGPWPMLGNFDNEFVTLVNPCAVKGISIFLKLAEQMPDVALLAVPTWGTNEKDRADLARHSNITVLDPVDDIDKILCRTRVLLVPSVWAEARSRIVLEAMLRGVPVLASDVGGIPEAKMGVPYLIPVRPIEKYQPRLDEQMVPVAEVPEQDIEPWHVALQRLIADRTHYEDLSKASREAALAYVGSLNTSPLETLFAEAMRRPKRKVMASASPTAEADGKPGVENLSPEKRRLLALLLRRRASSASWFPTAETVPDRALRLFCFPHAGGGTSTFSLWGKSMPSNVAVCPVRLPGREKRMAEAPFQRMKPLVEALGDAIQPYLAQPFAFFGHSMGAVVAFELARHLRRRGQPLPVSLFVSAARAPQFRRAHIPPPAPSQEQFLDELRRLGGVPQGILENPKLLRMVLPMLQADAELYRNYIYGEDTPFAFPIRAYRGAEDSNIQPEHLEGWAEQTQGSFAMQVFPGGHFYIQTAQAEFLEALSRDILALTHQS